MSGTSGDGVSVVLAEFGSRSFKILDYSTFPYPSDLSGALQNSARLAVPQLSFLNVRLGDFFSRGVLDVLKRNRISPAKVKVVGSHGQTVYHGPNEIPPSTFQIGEPAVIAEKTGITVISDFRARDVAAGGQGAPLTPFFFHYFYGDGPVRAFQNIGGIANVAVVGKKLSKPVAFDTGPGNCLIDWAARTISNGTKTMDLDGSQAGKGAVLPEVLQELTRHSYYSLRPPKSTGREIFGEEYIPSSIKNLIVRRPNDALRTLTALTAVSIHQSYKDFIFSRCKPSEVVLSGGGALNPTLTKHIQDLFSPLPVRSIADDGIHPQALEPLAFAFFALRAMNGKPNHLPSVTGARGERLLGKITPGGL